MDAQHHYWDTFATLKANSVYISRYRGKVEQVDRAISMFSAVTASTAIGAWAVWRDLAFVWAAAIAAAQVLNAIRPYLPFRSRLTALGGLGPDLETLALAAEADWFKVSRGGFSEEATFQLAMNLKRKAHQATVRHFKGLSLPEDRRLREMARADGDAYMLTFKEE